MSSILKIMLQAASGGASEYYINVVSDSSLSLNSSTNGYPFVDPFDNIYLTDSPEYNSSSFISFSTDVKGTLSNPKFITGSFINSISASGVDSSGNLYVAGDFNNPSRPVVAKVNSSGTVEWAKSVSNISANSRCHSLAVSNSYVATTGVAVPSTQINAATWLYDLSGNLQWRVAHNRNLSFGWDVTLNEAAGKCYVAGLASNKPEVWSINISNGSFNTGFRDEFTDGRFEGITCDSGGNVIAVGYISSGSTFNAILVKFNSTLSSVIWSRVFSLGAGFCGLYNVITDSFDNVYVGGLSNGGNYSFIGKYDSSGNYEWGVQFADVGLNDRTYLYKLGLDSAENIIATGFTSALSGSTSKYDSIVLRYPNDGSITGTFDNFVISSLTPTTGSLSLSLSSTATSASSWSTTTNTTSMGSADAFSLSNSVISL